jgi:hypothetical protein
MSLRVSNLPIERFLAPSHPTTTSTTTHSSTQAASSPSAPSSSPSSHPIHIITASGRRYRARCAIVTLPVPLLRASASASNGAPGPIAFDPPLPPSKSRALERIGMGLFNKVRCMPHTDYMWAWHV